MVSTNTRTGSMGCSMNGTFTVAVILGCFFWDSSVTAELVEAGAWNCEADVEAVELVAISVYKLGNKSLVWWMYSVLVRAELAFIVFRGFAL